MKTVSVISAISLILALSLNACKANAQGQSNCVERTKVVETLQTKYGESRQSFGLSEDNRVVETYANTENGTWTIIITLPSGISCLLAAGNIFTVETPTPTGEKI